MGFKPRTPTRPITGDGPLRELARALRQKALSLPEAWEDFPWEVDRVAKVGKKVFVFFGTDAKLDDHVAMSVKLPTSGEGLLAMPFAEPTSYGLGKWGWVTITCTADDLLPVELLESLLVESYRAIAPRALASQV